MDQYKANFRDLTKLIGAKDYLRIENNPYLPLVVEKLDGQSLISLCHYGVQNGDLMRDPEVVFKIEKETAKPVYYRNDYAGFEHATIEEQFGDVPVKPGLQKSLDSFCRMWWKNIKEQGFFEVAKKLSTTQAVEKGPEVSGPDMDPDRGPEMDL